MTHVPKGRHGLTVEPRKDAAYYADRWLRREAPEPEREALAALFEACQRDAIEACARVADRWAEYYPVKAFPEHGESLDCRAAHHGRHSSKVIAEDIRALALEEV